VNLFLLNLLPVPPLDGGRLVFIGLAAIARRPVPRHIETLVNGVGMVLLLGLIVVVTVGDVASYF
jgi:regulator of sigma E protease